MTSGTYSVRLQRPLAFAWINSDITVNDKVCQQRTAENIDVKVAPAKMQ